MANRKVSSSSSQQPTSQSPSTTTTAASKSTDGPHVKRPQNSWILYRSQRLQEYRGPKKEQASYSQMLAAQWAAEPPEVKEYYKQLSEKMKEEHALANPGYKYKPKSKAEKDAIREAKRLEREEEKRRKAESRANGSMPIRTKTKRTTQPPNSSDTSSPDLPDTVSESPSTSSDGQSASRPARSNVTTKHRVASPKPIHYQPYRLPGSYYPASAYGPHRKPSDGTFSTRLTPPPSSADATPQSMTRSLPHGQDPTQNSTSESSAPATFSLYPAVPSLGQEYGQPSLVSPASAEWNQTTSGDLPPSPPEESLTSSLTNGAPGNAPAQVLNPADWLSLWPSLEAGFNWTGMGQLNGANAQQAILGQLDQNTELFQWRFSADSQMVDSLPPSALLPKNDQQYEMNGCPREANNSKEMSIHVPQSALLSSLASNPAGDPEHLVNGLSLSDTKPTSISPSALTPPVEAGQVPLTINFPPGFSLPPISAESLGTNGNFWDAFVASNLPDGAQNDHGGNNTINSLSPEQFGYFTGGGGPALNVGGFASTDGGLTFDLDNLDWTTFSRLQPSDGDEFVNSDVHRGLPTTLQDSGDTPLADLSMRNAEAGLYEPMLGDDQDGDMSFGSMVSIPSSMDEDEPKSLIHKTSSRSLRVVSPENEMKEPSTKAKFVPPSGASNFTARRVAGNWRSNGASFPSTIYGDADSNTIDIPWNYQVNLQQQEDPILHQDPTTHDSFRSQPRHVSEQYTNTSYSFHHLAPRSQSAAPPSIIPSVHQRAPTRSSAPHIEFPPTLVSDGPPPIPPRPTTLQTS